METITKVLAIAPYTGLAKMLERCCGERDDVKADVFIGDRDEGARVAVAEFHKREYDVILSRGFTAIQISSCINAPVVDIQVSGYDILRMTRLAQSFSGKYSIIGFHSLAEAARLVCGILDYRADIVAAEDIGVIEQHILSRKEQGYGLIIGDVITADIAKRNGLQSMLVTSGQESVHAALDECVRTKHNLDRSAKQMSLLQNVLREKRISALLVDGRQQPVQTFPGPAELKALTPALQRYLRAHPGQERGEFYYWQEDERRKVSVIRHIAEDNDDTLCIIEPLHILPKEGKITAYRFIEAEGKYAVSLNAISANSEIMKDVLARARQFADSAHPIMIDGERGVGKEVIAHAIHNECDYRGKPLFRIDCAQMTASLWKLLYEDERSPFFDQGYVVYFRGIDSLPLDAQQELARYISASALSKRHRLISSVLESPDALIRDGRASLELVRRLRVLSLHIPSLCERKEELQSLAGIYIGAFNEQHARSVVGLEPEALRLLQNNRWQENIEQLERVMRELVLTAQGEYISPGDVLSVLGRHDGGEGKDAPTLDLRQPLADIERDVISIVLKQEQMNQSKAAKRLGISRSTMWRKMR